MKHYKTPNGSIFGFELDGSQDHLIESNMVEITNEELLELTTVKYTTEQISNQIRFDRNTLIAQTDWTQLPDVPQVIKDKWVDYRQALRDITIQNGFPSEVLWPDKPI